MRVQWHMEKKRNANSYFSMSNFTEMELEHGHDTESMMGFIRPTKIHPDQVKNFIEATESKNADLQQAAFNQNKL